MNQPVLVAGASGYIGSHLIEALLERGVSVRAVSRQPERLIHLQARDVEVVQADVLDRRSLRPALLGVRAAYYLVHSMGEGTSTAFADYDRYAAQNFAREARHLDQIIYLGGLGRPEDDLSPHLRSRLEVGSILQDGHPTATVLRAGMVIGSGSASFIMLKHLVARLPLMVCPRWVETRSQPIGVTDVITYLAAALQTPEARGRSLEIGGPDVLTYRQMMYRTAAAMNKRRLIATVPVLTPKLSAYWVDLVTPVPASIAHPLIEGLRNEVVVHDHAAEGLMPFPLTSFNDAVRIALGA